MKKRLMAVTVMLVTIFSLAGCGSGDAATGSEKASADVTVSRYCGFSSPDRQQ